jgi:NitT/TauT family transport system substrate-binding protein
MERTRSFFALPALVALVLVPLLLACGGEGDGDEQEITIGLTFVPNIQFSPFYVADAKGYFKDEGLKVILRHHAAGEDQFGALVAGQEDFIFASGDEVLIARSKGVELVYLAQVYREYPVALIVPADSDIQTAADLAGHKVGLPGPYGANYYALLALLTSVGLSEQDIQLESVGFTQAQALLQGQVDAVMGYINNEPIQLEQQGMAVRSIPATEGQPLVSNGLAVLDDKLQEDEDLARKVVKALLKGVEYAVANPEDTVELSKEFVPTLTDQTQQASALAVLNATIPLWQTDGQYGSSDPAAWQSMAALLEAHGLLDQPVDVNEVWRDEYLP